MSRYYNDLLIHSEDYYDDELYHFGVKGMKWGVRKRRHTFGRKRPSRNKKDSILSEDEIQERKQKAIERGSAKDVLKYKNYMTQDELRTAKNRLQLESEIGQLQVKSVPGNKINTGLKYVTAAVAALTTINGAFDVYDKTAANASRLANASSRGMAYLGGKIASSSVSDKIMSSALRGVR